MVCISESGDGLKFTEVKNVVANTLRGWRDAPLVKWSNVPLKMFHDGRKDTGAELS